MSTDAPPAPPWLSRLARVAALLGLALAAWAAHEQDWTYDEPYHMQWARRLVVQRVSERASDPLWNSKTPVMALHVASKEAGRALGFEGRALSFWARLPGLLCYVGTLALAGAFARARLGGTAAALAVLGLALDPNLIAHGAVATVDAPYTLFTLLTLVFAVRLAERPGPGRALALGAALGLAFATKFTAFLLLPGLLLLPLCYGRARLGGWAGLLRAGALVASSAVLVVDLAYLGVGFARPLSSVLWKSAPLGALAAALPGLRLPLPIDFLTGLDICLAHERGRAWSVLILGRAWPDGVWWYFLVSWALKTPLLLLAAQLLGLWRLRAAAPSPALRFLGLNLLLSLAYFSLLFRAQIGYRYMLLGLPLLALLVARGLASLPARALLPGALAVALGALTENLPYAGNALAFTSPLVQPKREAYRFLTNSSIDWGQNDERVNEWLARQRSEHPGETLVFEPTHIRPGRNVIGLNSLAGGASFEQHRWLREHRRPEGHFRHTYLWFTIDAATYQRFLDENRTLRPRPLDEEVCGPAAPQAPIDPATWRAFPQNTRGFNAWVLCASTPGGAELALVGEQTGLLLGRAGDEPRTWDRLRAGEELTWRLEPGRHALAAIKMELFQGRLELRRGAAELSLRPALLLKKGRGRLQFEGQAPATSKEDEQP